MKECDGQSRAYTLVCFPPAGCSATIYQAFQKYLHPSCHLLALDYPGHGRKFAQPLESDIKALSQQLAQEINDRTTQEIILFGHSLGAALIWPVVEALKNQAVWPRIKMLVISSRPAPQHSQHLLAKHQLDDQALVQQLQHYQYVPAHIFKHPDMLRLCFKLIRHDFALSDALISQSPPCQTHLPVLLLHGDQDPDLTTTQMLDAWQGYTQRWLGRIAFTGHHFYFTQPNILKHMLSCIEEKFQTLHTASTSLNVINVLK